MYDLKQIPELAFLKSLEIDESVMERDHCSSHHRS